MIQLKSFCSLAVFYFVFAMAFTAQAAQNEPQYCNIDTFRAHEVNEPNIFRSRAFRFGDSILIGGGIGKSDSVKVVLTARYLGEPHNYLPQEKLCTFYFNKANPTAAKIFNHRYVSNPDLPTFKAGASPLWAMIAIYILMNEYQSVVTPNFSNTPVSFMSCLQNHKYVAFGCDGQHHRGPTVFAMLLAYSGCSPRTSVDIAVALWGKNWVANTTRYWIARRAYQDGASQPAQRAEWQKFFSQK